MRFGPVPLSQAEGAILAHSVALPQGRLRKGCRLGLADLVALQGAGLTSVTVARLDPDDLHEDEAALTIARALVPDPQAAGIRLAPVGTGRVNLHATAPGVVQVLADRVHGLNAVDPMITLATVAPWQRLAAQEMAATVKIISYGVAAAAVERAAKAGAGALRLYPARLRSAVLIETELAPRPRDPGVQPIANRLAALGVTLTAHLRSPHAEDALARTLAGAPPADLILILTASATSDPQDVAPAALCQAGGQVERFGMPVDPGNLLFLGQLGATPVIGLPGCARSPALNGADWVMERVICGIPVTGADIATMGVGGLLKEIPARGRMREARD